MAGRATYLRAEKHKRAAIDNMKRLDDALMDAAGGDDTHDDAVEVVRAGMLAASVLEHLLLYIGDGLHRIAAAMEGNR